MKRFRWLIILMCALGALIPALCCRAHPGFPASAIVRIDSTGAIIIHVRHDALAFALNETPVQISDEPMRRLLSGPREDLIAALQDARERFHTGFEVSANAAPIPIELIETPTAEAIDAARKGSDPVRLPIMLEFVVTAQLPADTTEVSIAFPEVLGDVITTIERPGEEPFSVPLRAGERSPQFTISLQAAGVRPGSSSAAGAPMGALEVAWRYIIMGVTHIIPKGLDHMLFVLGLFFLSTRLRALLAQVTAFTLAHSVTLTLATLGFVKLPSQIVEPVIAASIALVAVENLLTSRVHPWRPLIVFAFGMVHGLGFAGVLKDVGLPRGQLTTALVSFNIGVEIGQIGVIVTAMLVVGWWRRKPWYRRRIAMPASAVIALAGIWWTVQRALGL